MWRIPVFAAFIVILLIIASCAAPTRGGGGWGQITGGVADQMRR